MGWGTLPEVRDGSKKTLEEVRDRSGDSREGPEWVGDPREGPGRVGGTTGRSGMGQRKPSKRYDTGRGAHEEVRDGSRDT